MNTLDDLTPKQLETLLTIARQQVINDLTAMCECEPGEDEPACHVCNLIMEAL